MILQTIPYFASTVLVRGSNQIHHLDVSLKPILEGLSSFKLKC